MPKHPTDTTGVLGFWASWRVACRIPTAITLSASLPHYSNELLHGFVSCVVLWFAAFSNLQFELKPQTGWALDVTNKTSHAPLHRQLL